MNLACFNYDPGRDVPDHNRPKIRRIRFLTLVFARSDIHLASGNIEKLP